MIHTAINLPGLPKGFRAVRWGLPEQNEYVCSGGQCFVPMKPFGFECLIVEPTDDESSIRPFKDADDFFESLSGSMMLLNITTGAIETVLYVDDDGIETIRGAISYHDLLMRYEFADGRPCGYED